MKDIRVKPRKKPVMIASSIIAVMIAVCFLLLNKGSEETRGMVTGLLGMFLFLLICVLGGYFRSVLIFRGDGIYSITALFSRPVIYKWKSVDRILHEGHNYALYSTQNKWIGTVDDREVQLKDVLSICKSHHVRINENVTRQ